MALGAEGLWRAVSKRTGTKGRGQKPEGRRQEAVGSGQQDELTSDRLSTCKSSSAYCLLPSARRRGDAMDHEDRGQRNDGTLTRRELLARSALSAATLAAGAFGAGTSAA